MTNLRRFNLYVVMIIVFILLSACGLENSEDQVGSKPGQNSNPAQHQTSSIQTESNEENGKLTIMSYYEPGDEVRERLKKDFPNIEIEFNIMTYFTAVEEYRKSHESGTVPDIFIMDSSMLGSFIDLRTFVDLSSEPFQAESLIEAYPEHLKTPLRSFNTQKLLALPISSSPLVTFYRYDVMKEAGFPAEPEPLAAFMENPDNWLMMAETLKEKGHWISAWDGDPILLADRSFDVFDEEMNYLRNTEDFIQGFRVMKEISKRGLSLNTNLFIEGNENAISQEKTVMLHTGYFYHNFLKDIASETFGKWRITRLPFGLYGSSGANVAAISSESANKTEAWSILEWLTEEHLKTFTEIMEGKPSLDQSRDNFYGGQNVNAILQELIEQMPEYNLTPLDEKARFIWYSELFKEMGNTSLSAEGLALKLELLVTSELEDEITIVKNALKK